jgi:alkylation response protein AidB-like acyl-CoA dehydrogenase
VDFTFSEEQEELRRYARQWLNDRLPLSRVRELMDTPAGFDRDSWRESAELGWQAMAIPEEHGGAGFGFLELAVLLEEQGRALYTGPFLSTVVAAANAILLAGSDEQRSRWLADIASGAVVAAVAVSEDGRRWDGNDLSTSATPADHAWTLNGRKALVLDGHTADIIVVAAQGPDGVGLYVVDGEAAGVGRTERRAMDPTRRFADLTFEEVEVAADRRLESGSAATVDRVNDLVAVALALEQVGGAQAALDMAVSYAKERRQFDRPIGSFQAIKHMCADMRVAVEAARSAAYYAAWAVATGSDETPLVVPIAKAHCSEAFFRCAADNIQIHGGIGFTWEHDAHLYFKRAKTSEILFGTPGHHRGVLAERLGF